MTDAEAHDGSLGLMRWIMWEQRRQGEAWVSERDLTHEQSAVLAFLAQTPGVIQRDIARITRTSAPSVSRLLAGLESRGLVERRLEDDDARSRRVFATPAALQLISGFSSAMQAIENSILGSLDATERDTLHGLLVKVTASLPVPSFD